MMKKLLSLLILSTCVFFLAGCNNVKDLTDEETKLIAEYAADLLLKYDLNYVDRIDEGDKAVQTMTTDETTTEQKDSPEATTEEPEDKNVNDSTIAKEQPVGSESDIAKIAGVKDVSIKLKDYQIVEQYPATDEEEFIHIEASAGYQLLVIRFKVQNTAEDVVNISLMDKQLDYHIVCNGANAAKPMLTILMNDLGTLETAVQPGEEQEAVLIFQISDDMKEQLESVELYIHYNDMDNVIEIL